MAGELRAASWLQWRQQAVSAGGPDGEPWLLLQSVCSNQLRLGMLRAVQPSSALCEREQ